MGALVTPIEVSSEAGRRDMSLALRAVAFSSTLPVFAVFNVGETAGVQSVLLLSLVLLFAVAVLRKRVLVVRTLPVRIARLFLLWTFASVLLRAFGGLTLDMSHLVGFFKNSAVGTLASAVVFVAVLQLVRDAPRQRMAIDALVAGGVVNAVYGIATYVKYSVTGSGMALLYTNNAFGAQVVSADLHRRAQGFMSEPSVFVSLCLFILPLALVRRSWGAAMIIAASAVLSFSPTSLLLLLVLPVLLVVNPASAKQATVSLRSVVGGLAVLSMAVGLGIKSGWAADAGARIVKLTEVSDDLDLSTLARAVSIESGVRAWLERPLVGFGWGVDITPVLGKYQPDAFVSRYGKVLPNPTSLVVELLVRVGVVGLALFLGFLVSLLLAMRRDRESVESVRRERRALAAGLGLSVLQLSVVGGSWPHFHFLAVGMAILAIDVRLLRGATPACAH